MTKNVTINPVQNSNYANANYISLTKQLKSATNQAFAPYAHFGYDIQNNAVFIYFSTDATATLVDDFVGDRSVLRSDSDGNIKKDGDPAVFIKSGNYIPKFNAFTHGESNHWSANYRHTTTISSNGNTSVIRPGGTPFGGIIEYTTTFAQHPFDFAMSDDIYNNTSPFNIAFTYDLDEKKPFLEMTINTNSPMLIL